MTRRGRKPVGTGHVERLSGSEAAKLRMLTLLETLEGEITVPEACARLGIGATRFHALRGAWLQNALALLEPRRLGRPPQAVDVSELLSRLQTLEAQNDSLRQQLTAAEVRRDLAHVLPHVVHPVAPRPKKGAAHPPFPKLPPLP